MRVREKPERAAPGPALVVAILSACGIVVSLQQTLLLPLLPELPRLLDTTSENASWLVTATLLSGAVATPTITRLADMYGKRRMLVAALVLSVMGSLLGAVSQAVPLMISARALQGCGLALIPVAIAIMRDELPRHVVPLGVALMSATLAVGAGVGLPLCGLIVEHLDWHASFWLTGAVGIALIIATLTFLPESPLRTRGRFDLRGAVVLSVILTSVLLALSKGGQWGWTSAEATACVAVGVLLLVGWIPLELRTAHPLVDLRVAARPTVMLLNVASLFAGFAMFANILVTTVLLQAPEVTGYGLGFDVLHTGLWMVPNAAAFGIMAPVSAWLTRLFGPQVPLVGGAFLMAATYVGRVFCSGDVAQIVIGSVLVGTGTAMVYGAVPTLLMRAVPLTETASANGVSVLMRSIGTSAASATVAAITSATALAVDGHDLPTLHALNIVLLMAAASAFVTAAIGLPLLRIPSHATDADQPSLAGGTTQPVDQVVPRSDVRT